MPWRQIQERYVAPKSLRWAAIMLALCLAGLIGVTVVLVDAATQTASDVKDQRRANAQIPVLRSLLVDILDAETGQRGYLLTGRKTYLTPYLRASKELDGRINVALKQDSIRPDIAQGLLQVRRLTSAKLSELAETIRLYDAGNREAALSLVLSDKGQHIMDELRPLLINLIEQHRQIRDRLEDRVLHGAQLTKQSLIATVSLLTIITALAVYQVVATLRTNRGLLRRLEQEATHDPLTGLPNRRYLHEWMSQVVSAAERSNREAAVLLLDLDGFKQVNDTDGHEAGDALLIRLASEFQRTLRQSDFLCRLGGDEFALIASDSGGEENIRVLCERLLAVTRQVVRDEQGASAKVGVSIGVAVYPTDADSVTTLMDEADKAMYCAKKRGKGQYCFATEARSERAETHVSS